MSSRASLDGHTLVVVQCWPVFYQVPGIIIAKNEVPPDWAFSSLKIGTAVLVRVTSTWYEFKIFQNEPMDGWQIICYVRPKLAYLLYRSSQIGPKIAK